MRVHMRQEVRHAPAENFHLPRHCHPIKTQKRYSNGRGKILTTFGTLQHFKRSISAIDSTTIELTA